MKNEIVIFENQNVKLEVNIQDETVWLPLKQIAKLFDRDKSVISRHIKNILKEELDDSVVVNFATTAKDGKIYKVDYYNLDMIISVGYRVKFKNGIIFRKWANEILKDYMLKGYAVNNKRLETLEKTFTLLSIATRLDDEIKETSAKEVLNVLEQYTRALNLLDDYDRKTINKIKGRKSLLKISYEDCIDIINKMKSKEKSNLFALERNKGLEGIIGNIYQSFDDKDVYDSIEEKAANFLYMVVKNHVFIDGNKRIAATLFIYFLQFYNILYKDNKQIIDNNTLTALTILIAESNPKEKNILIDLVVNFLV
ncbi:MAG: virulence protein RhuM/Fic/DOC family protein [Bacilli bacterium]|nr:virulence protein RhuM/Fic/DOC family protein [Bacilli bacterium]